MPQESQPLDISVTQPGFFKTGTSLGAAGRYIDGNKVRFKNGRPEKWMGWLKFITTITNGVIRGALGWIDSGGSTLVTAGTAYKLYSGSDSFSDITPYRAVNGSGNLGNNPITTTLNSTTVSLALTAHGMVVGQHFHLAGLTAVNGVTANGEWIVLGVTDANDVTFTYTSQASGNGSGGGAGGTYAIEVQPGLQDQGAGLGWGVGTWGNSTWGTARSSGAVTLDLRTWFISKYGDELMVCPSGDTIFLWNEPNGDARPLPVAGAPVACRAMFVTAERYLVALGTSSPMTIQWPDVDTLNWNADLTNTANTRKLQFGNKMIAGARISDKLNVLWSDTAFYQMLYVGGQFIYDTSLISTDAGLIGPCAFANTPVGVFWMSPRDFFMWSGQMDYIPNRLDIRDYIYANLDLNRAFKINAGYDDFSNSVIFNICFTGDSEPSHYVEVTLDDYSWTTGTWDSGGNRTAVIHIETSSGPLFMSGDDAGSTAGSFLYEHNVGHDADGVSMPWQITRGIIGLDEGDLDVEIEYYEPDYERQVGTVTLEVRGLERPMVNWYLQDELYSIPQGTVLLHLAPVIGARYAQFIESGNSLGGDWRCGVSKIWVAPGGTAEA